MWWWILVGWGGGGAPEVGGAGDGGAAVGGPAPKAVASGSAAEGSGGAASGTAGGDAAGAAGSGADGTGAAEAGGAVALGAPKAAGSVHVVLDDAAVASRLKPGERLAHKAFGGGLGEAADASVALIEREGTLYAALLTADARVDSPPLHDRGRVFEVPAVLFMDVDPSPGVELVVVAKCVSGVGPEGAMPQPCNAVLRWDGTGFVRLGAVEEKIRGETGAVGVRRGVR
jgi:hypothetical protein